MVNLLVAGSNPARLHQAVAQSGRAEEMSC